MANVNRPKGLSPIQNSDGTQWSQGATLYSVASDASNTYAIGDIVMTASGSDADGIPLVTKWLGTVGATTLPLGVVVGIRVADPGVSLQGTSLSLEKAYLPLNAGAHYLYVVTDPSTIFEIQGDSTVWATTHMNLNCNITMSQNQTSLASSAPYSNIVATGPASTTSLPLQIVGLVQRPDNAFGAYAAIQVRWNVQNAWGAVTGRQGV